MKYFLLWKGKKFFFAFCQFCNLKIGYYSFSSCKTGRQLGRIRQITIFLKQIEMFITY